MERNKKNKNAKETKKKWNDIKDGMKYAISGYLLRWAYEERTNENVNEIYRAIDAMLNYTRTNGMIVEHKTIVSAPEENRNQIKVDVEFKTSQRAKPKTWTFQLG